MNQPAAYKWLPLSDLPENYPSLSSAELTVLHQIWLEQRESLSSLKGVEEFNVRLRREWAIETGILERIYTLDRGITQLLIEQGIDASLIPHSATDKNPELVAGMIRDHQAALEGLFAFVKDARSLSTSYVKELHAILTRNQQTCAAVDSLGRTVEVPLVRGDYKRLPNNPLRRDASVHEYCPPEQVASEMDHLIGLHLDHQKSDVPTDVEAAWLHHAFSQIHPFQDGNGRVARTLASLVFIKGGWFPLAIKRDDREEYIASLEAADQGSLSRLIQLFAMVQKRAFVRVLGIAGQMLAERKVDHVITAARDLLEKRRQALRQEWEKAKDTARVLQADAGQRLAELAQKLDAELGELGEGFQFFTDAEPDAGKRHNFFRYQVIQTARDLGYFANLPEYHAWARLVLKTASQAEILVSFHGLGQEYRGLLAASICFFRREETETQERQVGDVTSASDTVFQLNYREGSDQVRKRFREWLDQGLARGLDAWRQGL